MCWKICMNISFDWLVPALLLLDCVYSQGRRTVWHFLFYLSAPNNKAFALKMRINMVHISLLFCSTTNPTGWFDVCSLLPLHHTAPHVYLSPLRRQPDREQIGVETSSALLLVQIIPDIQNARASSGSRSVVSDVSEKPNVGEKQERAGAVCRTARAIYISNAEDVFRWMFLWKHGYREQAKCKRIWHQRAWRRKQNNSAQEERSRG